MNFVENDWKPSLKSEFEKEYYSKLGEFIEKEYETQVIYPKKDEIFQAFQLTPLHKVRVVILGQDPYHNENQAHGLCFSIQKSQKMIPPSLQNIYKELHSDLGCDIPNHGNLKSWAEQGVLLLNTVLTVRAHEANSHKNRGWENFTDAVIKVLNQENRPIVFLLWGRPAMEKKKLLDNPKHLILTAPHPSPLSAYRGFFGCGHFSKTNAFLKKYYEKEIDWQI